MESSFYGFVESSFYGFGRNVGFYCFDGEVCFCSFGGKLSFYDFSGNCVFQFWREIVFFFLVLARQCVIFLTKIFFFFLWRLTQMLREDSSLFGWKFEVSFHKCSWVIHLDVTFLCTKRILICIFTQMDHLDEQTNFTDILFDSHCLQLRRAEKWVWYWTIKVDPFHPSAEENHLFLESKHVDIKKKEKRKMLIQCCQGA